MSLFSGWFGGEDKSSPEAKALAALLIRLKAAGITLGSLTPPLLPTKTKKPLSPDESANLQDAMNAVAVAEQLVAVLSLKSKSKRNWTWLQEANAQLKQAKDILDEYLENIGATENMAGELEAESRDWPETGFLTNVISNAKAFIEAVLDNQVRTIKTPGDGDCCPTAFIVAALNAGLKHADREKIINMLRAQRKHKVRAKTAYPPGLTDAEFEAFITEFSEAKDAAKITAFKEKYFGINAADESHPTIQYLAACARMAIGEHAKEKKKADPDGEYYEENAVKHIEGDARGIYASLTDSSVEELQQSISKDDEVGGFVAELLAAVREQHGGVLPTNFTDTDLDRLLDQVPALGNKFYADPGGLLAKFVGKINNEDFFIVVMALLKAIISTRYNRESFQEQFKPHQFMSAEHAIAYVEDQGLSVIAFRVRSTGAIIVVYPREEFLEGNHTAQALPELTTTNPCLELMLSGELEQINQHWEAVDRVVAPTPEAAPAPERAAKPAAEPAAPPPAPDTRPRGPSRTGSSRRGMGGREAVTDEEMEEAAAAEARTEWGPSAARGRPKEPALKATAEPTTPEFVLSTTARSLAESLQQAVAAFESKKIVEFLAMAEKTAAEYEDEDITPTQTAIFEALVENGVSERDAEVLLDHIEVLSMDMPLVAAISAKVEFDRRAMRNEFAKYFNIETVDEIIAVISRLPNDTACEQYLQKVFADDKYRSYIVASKSRDYPKKSKLKPEGIAKLINLVTKFQETEKVAGIIQGQEAVIDKDALAPHVAKIKETRHKQQLCHVAKELQELKGQILAILTKSPEDFTISDLKTLCRLMATLERYVSYVVNNKADLRGAMHIGIIATDTALLEIDLLKQLRHIVQALGGVLLMCEQDTRFQGKTTDLKITQEERDAGNREEYLVPRHPVRIDTLEDMVARVAEYMVGLNIQIATIKAPIVVVSEEDEEKPGRKVAFMDDVAVHEVLGPEARYSRKGPWERADSKYANVEEDLYPGEVPSQATKVADPAKVAALLRELLALGVSEDDVTKVVVVLLNLKDSFWSGLSTDANNLDAEMLTNKTSFWVRKHITADKAAMIVKMFGESSAAELPASLETLFKTSVAQRKLPQLQALTNAIRTSKSGEVLPDTELTLEIIEDIYVKADLTEPGAEPELGAEAEPGAKPGAGEAADKDKPKKRGTGIALPSIYSATDRLRKAGAGLAIFTKGLRRSSSPPPDHPGSPPPPPTAKEAAAGKAKGVGAILVRSKRRSPTPETEPEVSPKAKAVVRAAGRGPIDPEFMTTAGKLFDSRNREFVGHTAVNKGVALRVDVEPGVHHIFVKELITVGYDIAEKPFTVSCGTLDTRKPDRIICDFDRSRTYEISKMFFETARERGKAAPNKTFYYRPDIKTKADAEQLVLAFLDVYAPRDNDGKIRKLTATERISERYFEKHANINIYLPALGSEARKLMQAALYEYLSSAELNVVTTDGLSSAQRVEANAEILTAFKKYVGFGDPSFTTPPPRSRGVLAGYGWFRYQLGSSTGLPSQLPDENTRPNPKRVEPS